MKLIVVPVKPIKQYIYTKSVRNVVNDSLYPTMYICNTSHSKNKCDAGIIKVQIKTENIIPVRLMGVLNSAVLSDVDYNDLKNIPSLNGIKIIGEKKTIDFGIQNIEPLSNMDLELLLK